MRDDWIYATERQRWFIASLRRQVAMGAAKTGIVAEWGESKREILRSEAQGEIVMLQRTLEKQKQATK